MPTCARTRCGKSFEQPHPAPPKRYCSAQCRKRAHEEAISAERHANGEIRQPFTQQDIVNLILEWARVYGEPPGARDWNPGIARRHGHPEIAERYYADGCWPSVDTVQRLFGSWSAGLHAAGLTPRRAGRPRKRTAA